MAKKTNSVGQVLNERVWNADQSWFLERIFVVEGHRFRLKIRHNAYTDQSYGRIERWNDTEWKMVHHIPGASLQGQKTVSYVDRNVTAKSFSETDINELINVGFAVVGITKAA